MGVMKSLYIDAKTGECRHPDGQTLYVRKPRPDRGWKAVGCLCSFCGEAFTQADWDNLPPVNPRGD